MLHLLPNAAIQWHVNSGDTHVREDLYREHRQQRPSVFCTSWWHLSRQTSEGGRRQVLKPRSALPPPHPSTIPSHAMMPRGTLKRSYFRETNPTTKKNPVLILLGSGWILLCTRFTVTEVFPTREGTPATFAPN